MLEPKIVDYRMRVPRRTGMAFARRRLENIKGVVLHQALGGGTVDAIAKYHTSPECHIAPGRGCPSICYTYYVHRDGTIYWCNDLEAVTWSQGGGAPPLEGTKGNTNYLAICFQGDFSGTDHVGKDEPSTEQLDAAERLWFWLKNKLGLAPDALFGHHDFGKPACPGHVLKALIDRIKKVSVELVELTPKTVVDMQKALIKLGYDIGKSGADNYWGPKTQGAVVQFQRDKGLPITGRMDTVTALGIAKALAALPKPEPVVEVSEEPPKRLRGRFSSPTE